MPKFYAEMKNKETNEEYKVEEISLIDFNKKTIYSEDDVKLLCCDFAGNKVTVDTVNKTINVNGENIELGKVHDLVKVKCFRRVRMIKDQNGTIKKVDFYGVGFEDGELARNVFLDKHGLWKLNTKKVNG